MQNFKKHISLVLGKIKLNLSKDIENVLRGVGYTPSVIGRARRELRKEKLIDFRKDGSNRDGDKQETIYYLTENC